MVHGVEIIVVKEQAEERRPLDNGGAHRLIFGGAMFELGTHQGERHAGIDEQRGIGPEGNTAIADHL